jgi:hypothetical protein
MTNLNITYLKSWVISNSKLYHPCVSWLGNKGSSQVKIKTGHLFMSAISRPISCKRLGLVDPVNNHPQVPARRFIHSESPKPSSAVRIEASGETLIHWSQVFFPSKKWISIASANDRGIRNLWLHLHVSTEKTGYDHMVIWYQFDFLAPPLLLNLALQKMSRKRFSSNFN